jgi:hypothetical protein
MLAGYMYTGTAQSVFMCVGRQTCDEVAYCDIKAFCADVAPKLVGRKLTTKIQHFIVVTYFTMW